MDKVELIHASMVAGLVKDSAIIRDSLTCKQAGLIHMIMGICGEAGELLDAVKKHVIYDKPLDSENVIEELGDIEFYMEGLRQELSIKRDHTLQHNMEKLSKRYPNYKYSNERAQDRADKK